MPRREPKIDTRLREVKTDKLIQTGVDPKSGIIGPDDKPKFGQSPSHYEMRTEKTYPDVPQEAKHAEIKYVLPMANHLAQTLRVDMIDEIMYEKTLKQLRQRMLFVVLNMYKLKTQDGFAWWDGIVVMCKQHPLALVRFKMHISTQRIGIAFVKVWDSQRKIYVLHGDKEQKQLMDRNKATKIILDYLDKENVLVHDPENRIIGVDLGKI